METTKQRALALLDLVPSADFTLDFKMKMAEGTDESQICRTCAFSTRRLHLFSLVEKMRARKEGIKPEDMECKPTSVGEVRNTYSDNITRVVKANGTVKWRPREVQLPATGHATTCGQELQSKCLTCARLVRQELRVVGGINTSTNKPWYRTILLGGHCSIPAEGIMVKGVSTTCDRKPIVRELNEGTCATCGNCQTFSGEWISSYPSVNRIDLTAYEMEQAKRAADPDAVGLAIWSARQLAGTVMWPSSSTSSMRTPTVPGLLKYYEADVISKVTEPTYEIIEPPMYSKVRETLSEPDDGKSAWITWAQFVFTDFETFKAQWSKDGHTAAKVINESTKMIKPPVLQETGTRVIAWKVRFRGSGAIAELIADNDDPKLGVVLPSPNPGKVVVHFLSPYHRFYGLSEVSSVNYPAFPRIQCPVCAGKGTIRQAAVPGKPRTAKELTHECYKCHGATTIPAEVENIQVPKRVHSPGTRCLQCTAETPCYAHAKGLHMEESEDGVAYNFATQYPESGGVGAERKLTFNGERVQDATGGYPDPNIFRVQLRGLLERYPQNSAAIISQYGEMTRKFARTRGLAANLNMGSFMSIEPGKPYCTLHMSDPTKGLDLRREFGDWFGDPRSVRTTNPMHDRDEPKAASDSYFSREQADAQEDWQRITNPGERIAEEIARNDSLIRSQRTGMPGFNRHGEALEPFMMPDDPAEEIISTGALVRDETFMREQIRKLMGQHGTNPEYLRWLIAKYESGDFESAQYVEWLDITRAVPISEDGAEMMVSNRRLHHGYEIKGRTGANKKRKTTGSQADVEMVHFDRNTDSDSTDDRMVGFICTVESCGAVYSVDEINDPENPTCTAFTWIDQEKDLFRVCKAPLTWDEQDREWEAGNTKSAGTTDPTDPYRRAGSPVLASGPNSSRWQSQQRLQTQSCNFWRPRGWGRRNYQTIAPQSTNANRHELDVSDWIGKKIRVQIICMTYTTPHGTFMTSDGAEMVFTIGEDINPEAPLIQALISSHGQGEFEYAGGVGRTVLAKAISVE